MLFLTDLTCSVYCLDVDPRLDILISGSRDRSIKVWDMTTGELVTTLENHHAGSILCLKFDFSMVSEDNGMGFMVSGSSDRSIVVWEVDLTKWRHRKVHKEPSKAVEGRVRSVLTGHGGGVLDLKIDDNWIVSW